MRKPLSTMTGQDFVRCARALSCNYIQMAKLLGKSPATISNYISERRPIPQDVARLIFAKIQEKISELRMISPSIEDSIGKLITHANEHASPELHRTQGRFMLRQTPQDTMTFPVYRMNAKRFAAFVNALKAWHERVRELAREHGDETRQRDYQLEIADLKAIVAALPRHAPYDIVIQRNEWAVVSRALRHLNTPDAQALRIHWGRHKGCGYPINRQRNE